MANDTGNLFLTLMNAATDAASILKYKNAFLDAIYWDYQPVVAVPYKTLDVIIPTVSEGNVQDIQSGPLAPTDTRHSAVSIVLDRHYSSSFVVKSWDQIRTPLALRQKYMEPRFEELKRKMNRSIAELVNTTNFTSSNSYALISGATDDAFVRTDIAGAWKNLAAAGVPVDDPDSLSFITSPLAYSNVMAATAFSSEAVVGVSAAEAAQQRAVLVNQFGAKVLYDQHLAKFNSGKEPGILMHQYAIAGVTADPPQGGSGVEETTVMFGNVPVQIQMQYSLRDQGWLINIHCFWGVKVVRPDFASLVETA